MSTKHTPGPWQIGHKSQFGTYNPSVIHTEEGVGVATVYGIPMHVRLEEITGDAHCANGLANARLIAAAPELLAAAKVALDFISSMPGDMGELEDQLATAIDKAEGA